MTTAAARRSPFAAAILLREAARSARQWRTYAARVAFSGALIAVVLLAIAVGTQAIGLGSDWVDPASLAKTGRWLFLGFAACEIGIAMVLAPLMVARAVIEEREEQTLDLVVLTKLTPGQILGAKVASSLLLITTIVLGALPVLGIVMSLGGVSVVEVVAVTLDAVIAIVVLGMLGGFFALFTRSQVLATVFAVIWGFLVFLIVPWVFVSATAAVDAASWVSPFYGPAARGWAALLPAVAYVPVVVRLFVLGRRVFEMRTANVAFGRMFSNDLWRSKWWLLEGAALLCTGLILAPFGAFGSWIYAFGTAPASIGGGWAWTAFGVASRGTVWLVTVQFIAWCTWIYLRLGAEWVIAMDAMVLNQRSAKKGGKVRQPSIAYNPVVWRETRLRMFAAWGVAFVIWLVLLWGVFQSMLWMIPGGLLVLGVVNALLAWFGAAWFSATSIEKERREGTLELLMTTTMSSWSIVWGKVLATAIPTLPMLVIAVPLVFVGIPHASIYAFFGSNAPDMVPMILRGATVAMWVTAFWAFLVTSSVAVSVRIRNPRAAYGVNVGFVGAFLAVPWMIAIAFSSVGPIRVAARVVLPIVAVQGPWWEPLLGTFFFSVAAVALFVLLGWRLRPMFSSVMR